ncbi:unnamed protein product [Rotaria magnacalcarata]|uniref:ODAD1 central coiled coil region domain-containing protein n=2 Tax=Rotaria magnacalcarata TaxID=392030 RepID=A0A817AB69_9BILA|nr:unnamed protein product [Rotaria magnacalcarata]
MTLLNRTVFDIPLIWNRRRFLATHNKRRLARKLIETSINVQLEKQMRTGFSHNIEIEQNITEIDEHLLKYHDKLRLLDNMIELASQSLRIYFDKRMESVRAIIKEHCNAIEQVIQEEDEHWKEIHSIMNQNLLNPGDIRSRNNNYPRVVQKSPAANIQTIEEVGDDDDDNVNRRVSRQLNTQTLTPLFSQMTRKSQLESKRLTVVPSIKVHSPGGQDISVFRKDDRFSMNMLPRNTIRRPFEIIETTFVVKPTNTLVDGEIQNIEYDDEANGTYRAPHRQYHSYLSVTQPNPLLTDTQPNIPTRLCFSPTMLQDATVSNEDDTNNKTSSSSNENNKVLMNAIFTSLDQNRKNVKQFTRDNYHFGQTFFLDTLKTEQSGDDQKIYKRPNIQDDDDVVIIGEIRPSIRPLGYISHTTNNTTNRRSYFPNQQESKTVQETVATKPRRRVTTTKVKAKSIIVTTRKTRSAAKIIAEREAATAAAVKAALEKTIEKKRKTRKRKQSKSIDRLAETSDEDYEDAASQSNFSRLANKKRKTKLYKKTKTDHHPYETSEDDDDDKPARTKRKTRRRTQSNKYNHKEEILNNKENSKRKTKKLIENDIKNNQNEVKKKSARLKKVKLSIIEDEEKLSKEKKRSQKLRKIKNGDEQTTKHKNTRASTKFIPINNSVDFDACNACHRSENNDPMKLMEFSSRITALTAEETNLKSLHRRLEMRIKRFLHRTHNSIVIQEKLLNIEKCSKNELLLRQSLIQQEKPPKDYKQFWSHIQYIEADNKNVEKTIDSLRTKIKEIEKDSERNRKIHNQQDDTEQYNNKTKLNQAENQLHRMNLELSKICASNTELRINIKRMLDERREMIEEYNRLRIALQNATDESRRLTHECSESFANRRNMLARMRAIRDQHERDEKKLLNDIRELDRLSESNYASKNFIVKKSNVRQEQTRLNELFSGKRAQGVKSAYTANEFRHLFRIGFDQDFFKEKVLNRTVETFIGEQEQVFTLFEYSVELVNELNYLHEDLDNKRKYISNLFLNDNIDTIVIKDIFATLEYSVNKANTNVQSLHTAKQNLRIILDTAYQLINNLFLELNCDRNIILMSNESINDRNILFYLATIESRVQELLFMLKTNRKGGGTHGYTDDTTISWRIIHSNMDQPYN